MNPASEVPNGRLQGSSKLRRAPTPQRYVLGVLVEGERLVVVRYAPPRQDLAAWGQTPSKTTRTLPRLSNGKANGGRHGDNDSDSQ